MSSPACKGRGLIGRWQRCSSSSSCAYWAGADVATEASGRPAAVEQGEAVLLVAEDHHEQLAEQPLDPRIARAGRGGPGRRIRHRLLVPAVDRIDIEGAGRAR